MSTNVAALASTVAALSETSRAAAVELAKETPDLARLGALLIDLGKLLRVTGEVSATFADELQQRITAAGALTKEINVSNNITPAAPGIIEENLISADDVTLCTEHVLLDLVMEGVLRTEDETSRSRAELTQLYSRPYCRPLITSKSNKIRDYMYAK